MENTTFNTEQIERFVHFSSPAGLLAIYTLSLSLKKQRAFDRENFAKEIFPTTGPDYFYGFIVACHALDIVNFNFKDKIITVTYVNKLIEEATIEKLVELEKTESFKQLKEKIENYFN